MTALPNPDLISAEEYLEGERFSDVRHEYLDGYVYAMAGASDDHNRIVINIGAELREKLRGKSCEAFIADMKVRIPPKIADAFYYPDVLVACDPADNAKYFRKRPTVIFEVLSPETERIDRHEKALAYWSISSLKAYVLVEQNRAAITVLRRKADAWEPQIVEGLNATLQLSEIEAEISLMRIYERTSLGQPR